MTNLDIAQELIMKFHKEKPEQMHLLQFSMWIDENRNIYQPQEPTLEELLENMPTKRNNANLHLYLDGEWCAEYMYEMDSGMIDIGGYGPTPRLALLALKEKLSTNQ